MSDVSQGPGWWIASDGKWYPPESHPSYQPSPPPPPMYAPPTPYASGPAPYASGPAQYPYQTTPAQVVPPLAEYGQRLGGWLIDWVILLAVAVPIAIATHSFHHTHVGTTTSFHVGMPGVLLSPLIVILYGTLMCGSPRGQTLGMMIAGTRAVKQATGRPIGYGAALGRAAFEELMAAILFVPWILDVLFPLWDPMNQTLHDKVSGTIVVRVQR